MVPVEAGVTARAQPQQPVHGGGRVPAQLGQPFRRPPRRRRQHDLRALRRGQGDHRLDGERFAAARAAGQHGHPLGQRQPNRLLLLGGQLRAGAGPQPGQRLIPVEGAEGGHPIPRCGPEPQQGGGQRGLGPVKRHQIHCRDPRAADAGDGFTDHPLGRGEVGQAAADQIRGHPEDRRGVGKQVRLGQVAVAVVGGLRQRVLNAGLHPPGAVVRDPHRLRDGVGGPEADPPHLGGQPVRLMPNDGDGPVAVLLVDPHRQRGGHPDALQEDHHLLDGLLLLPRLPDHRGAFGPQARDLDQPLWLLLDHPQGVHAEVPDNPGGGPRPDPLDQTGAQVAFDALDGGRQHRGVRVDLELPSVAWVRAPPAHQPQALPRLDPEQRPHHRQQVRTTAVGGHPGDRVASLVVGVGDPLQHRVQHRPAATTPLRVPGRRPGAHPPHRASRHDRDQRPRGRHGRSQ